MLTPDPVTHGVRWEETAFYVIHRRRQFGPFDYEWTPDLRGVELTYQGCKYGEFHSARQLYMDLREFQLPQRVMQVAVLVSGGLLFSLQQGESQRERRQRIAAVLRQFGCERFAASLEADLA